MGLRASGRHKYVQSWCCECRKAAVYAGRKESRGPTVHISEPAFYKDPKDIQAPKTIEFQNGSEIYLASTQGKQGPAGESCRKTTTIMPMTVGEATTREELLQQAMEFINKETTEHIRTLYYNGCNDSCKTRSRNFMIDRLKRRWAKGKW